MDEKTVERLKDFECEVENVLTIIREDKHNPNDVLIGYILQNLTASQVLLKTLIEIEVKK